MGGPVLGDCLYNLGLHNRIHPPGPHPLNRCGTEICVVAPGGVSE